MEKLFIQRIKNIDFVLKKLETVKKLKYEYFNKGSFGNIYLVKLGKLQIIMKQVKSENKKKEKEPEYYFNKKIQKLLNKNNQNFLIMYPILNVTSQDIKSYTIFFEKADTILNNDCLTTFDDELSILLQILYGLYNLQTKLGIFHYDIKKNNILIKNIKQNNMTLEIPNFNKIIIKNVRYLVLISDFNVSISYHPDHAQNNYCGERNAKIINNTFVPIITDNYLFKVPKTNKIKSKSPVKFVWKDNIVSTCNRFFKKHNDNLIDLKDIQTFPPFEFYSDVQDVITMFLGGKRITQPGNHQDLNISEKFSLILRQYCLNLPYPWISFGKLSINDVHLILANKLIEDIIIKNGNIL